MKPDWVSDCGRVTLYCGDCLEVLPTLDKGSIDAVVTDPPYGIGVTKMTLGNGKRRVYRGSDWDSSAPDVFSIIPAGVPAIVWGGNHFAMPASQKWLVWDKGTGSNSFADCELAWTNQPGAIRKFFRSWVGRNAKERGDADRWHPTQKPVELMEWCLSFIKGETILDPYMGSGTTIIAAIRKDKKAIGIELDPGYFAIAKKRIQDELAKHPLLETVA